jgi:hypothetical protein
MDKSSFAEFFFSLIRLPSPLQNVFTLRSTAPTRPALLVTKVILPAVGEPSYLLLCACPLPTGW